MSPNEYKLGILADNGQSLDKLSKLLSSGHYLSPSILVVHIAPIPDNLSLGQGFYTRDVTKLAACRDIIVLVGQEESLLPKIEVLSGRLDPQVIVVSFVPNLYTETLTNLLAHSLISRALLAPNTEASSSGFVLWYRDPNLDDVAHLRLLEFLNLFGEIYQVGSESSLQKAQAWLHLIASNTVQVFEAFEDVLMETGLSESEAKELAINFIKTAMIQVHDEGDSLNSIEHIRPLFEELNLKENSSVSLYDQLRSILIYQLLFSPRRGSIEE